MFFITQLQYARDQRAYYGKQQTADLAPHDDLALLFVVALKFLDNGHTCKHAHHCNNKDAKTHDHIPFGDRFEQACAIG